MKRFRGIIFDCDGVLFESRQANLAYYNAVLAHFGEASVTAEDHQVAHICHTAASPEVFRTLLGAERVEEALAFAADLSYRQFIPYLTPEPDLLEVLDALSEQMPLAVATNRGYSMSEILAHFGLEPYFQVVVTSRQVRLPKPHPEMLFFAAERLGVAVTELVFVGDSELDREAARGAGMPFVSYKWHSDGAFPVCGHRELMSLVLEGGGRLA